VEFLKLTPQQVARFEMMLASGDALGRSPPTYRPGLRPFGLERRLAPPKCDSRADEVIATTAGWVSLRSTLMAKKSWRQASARPTRASP
jgi:hypothetical protein